MKIISSLGDIEISSVKNLDILKMNKYDKYGCTNDDEYNAIVYQQYSWIQNLKKQFRNLSDRYLTNDEKICQTLEMISKKRLVELQKQKHDKSIGMDTRLTKRYGFRTRI